MKTVEVKIPVGLMCRLCCCLFIFISLSLSAQNIPLDNWVFKMNGEEKWLKAAVPGTVHTDLMMNARIPDPFVEQNETTVGWVGKSDWEYQSEFTLTDSILQLEQIELCFEGLDTYADVYLNDVLLGSSDNMFRSWIYNVKQFVKTENKLKVRFHAVEPVATKLANKVSYTLPEGLRCYTRKAQYQYGWDWGPRLLTCGIWKPVYLRGAGAIQLQSLFVNAVDSGLPLKLQASVGITATESRKVSLELSCKQFPVTVLQEVVLQKGYQLVRIPFLFPDGKRWYPWQKGEQPLYDFSCRVIESNVSPVKCTAGFSSAQLIQEKDSIGESFGFRINDKNLYARGANLIPPHLFLPSVPDSEYETLVKKAKAANINMLRVWGGGAYLPESFYRYCDQYGMMVWQDFMFACSMVPGDSAFADNVRKEAIEQVQRLSVHPCIVLWCGNNESDEGWHNWGWQKQFNYSKTDSASIWKNYTRLFHEILPEVVDSFTPEIPYWPSSPSLGWGRAESMQRGDSHYWGVWWGMEPFEKYKEKTGRFMSEYGFQSAPATGIWKGVVSNPSLTSKSLRSHQKHPKGFETIDHYLKQYFKVPTDWSDYTYLSQLQQAYGMKIAMDAHRCAYPKNQGSLFWQWNDCWPVVSWSAIDSRENEKLFYYTARQAFDTLYIHTEETVRGLETTVHNDGRDYASVTIRTYFIYTNKVSSPAGIDEVYLKLPVDTFVSTALLYPRSQLTFLEKESVAIVTEAVDNFTFKVVRRDFLFRCKPNELKLSPAVITVRQTGEDKLTISSDVFVYGCYLYDEEGTASFGDNGFHLLPGERKLISFKGDFSKIKWKCLNNIP